MKLQYLKKSILYSLIIFGGFSILLVITSGKSESRTSMIKPSDELDFLDVNLTTVSFDAKFAYDNKNYREAAKKFIEILHHKPNDVATLYNLASCYSYLKKPELAAKALLHAFDAGLNDYSFLISDSTWNPIRSHEAFKPILEQAKTIQLERGESFLTECKVLVKSRLRKPDSYEPTKAYPLLIFLHGYGGNAESFMPFRDKMGASDFFVAAVQGPYQSKVLEVNGPSYSWFYLSQDKEIWKRSDPMVVDFILSVIDEIKGKYNISGVYLAGHSQGGALAYLTGINNPDKIDGIICNGAGNPKDFLDKENLVNASTKLPILISHGWADPSFNKAQEAKRMFLDLGFNVTFKPFQGGHWVDVATLIETREWIEALEKK